MFPVSFRPDMASTQDRAQERALSDDIRREMMWKCTSNAGCWFVKILYILFLPFIFCGYKYIVFYVQSLIFTLYTEGTTQYFRG